jgi:hypothetical protein
MTPDAKPSMIVKLFGFGDVKNITVAAPRAVTNHVQRVAMSAMITKLSIQHLL